MVTARTGSRRPRAPQAPGLDRDKIALIHVAKRDCKLTEDDYRALLQGAAGVDSAKALTSGGFRRVMDRLKALGFTHRPAGGKEAVAVQRFGPRPGMATDAQVEAIHRMWASWSASTDEKALGRWLERSFGVSNLRFATVATAQMAIEALKAMLARKQSGSRDGSAT